MRESVRPIFTLNTSNDAVLRKEVPFTVIEQKFYFSLIYSKNSKKITMTHYGKNFKIL